MILKLIYPLLFLIYFTCCSFDSESEADNRKHGVTNKGEKQLGLRVEIGQRQGMQYFDSSKTEYNYRYYTITLTNDSTLPIHLHISPAKPELAVRDTLRSKVFLLPRHLTPEEQHFDTGGMSKGLKLFLDRDIDTPVSLQKTINIDEKCVMTFGILTARKDVDPTTPFDTEFLISLIDKSKASVKLKLNDKLIISCGDISFGPN